jgi:protein gp37
MTKIEWCDETINPMTGCTPIARGCINCYAQKFAKRMAGRFGYPKDEPFSPTFHPKELLKPDKWKKPKRIFVTSMGDLFHHAWVQYSGLPDGYTGDTFPLIAVMQCVARNPRHTFIFLTKRPDSMLAFYRYWTSFTPWPKNIWCGVSCSSQRDIDTMLPVLVKMEKVSVRFVSLEPLLEKVTIKDIHTLDWVIVGGETGSRSRYFNMDWARIVRCECFIGDVPFFFKSSGSNAYDTKFVGESTNKVNISIEKTDILNGKCYREFPKGARE